MSTTQLPKAGDNVVILTSSLCRYEGIFDKVWKERNSFMLRQVKSFGTENRQARTEVPPSNEIFASIEFRANEVKEFVVVGAKKPLNLQADPAIVRVENHRSGGARKPVNKQPGGYPSMRVPESVLCYDVQRVNENYRRHFRQNRMPWMRQMPQPRSRMPPLGPNSPRFQQTRTSPQPRHADGQPGWFKRARGPSEGVFPQKNPGVKSNELEEYDFEKAIEEFKQLDVGSEQEGGNEANPTADSPSKKEEADVEKVMPAYDKDSFFDNLKGSAAPFESQKKSPEAASQKQHRPQQMDGRNAPRYTRYQSKDNLIETFGEDTVASLYYTDRPAGHVDLRKRTDYRPTVYFHKQFRANHMGPGRSFAPRQHPVLMAPLVPTAHGYHQPPGAIWAMNPGRKSSSFMY